MINLNFKNAFPKPSKEFDQKIERTLQKIVQEEERNNMKKHHLFSKKILIVAAAAILVIGTGVFASGKITSYVSQSSSIPNCKANLVSYRQLLINFRMVISSMV